MNIGIDSLVEEIICVELESAGIELKLIDQIIESIKYNCKETNFLNNSVADSNYYAAEERKESQKLIDAQKALVEEQNRHDKELQELRRNASWSLQRKQERIEELEKQLR